jgi:hypothetical protein
MSLSLGQLGYLKCLNPAVSLTTAPVGGGVSATQINGSSISEIHFPVNPNALGGATITQYNKIFMVNSSTTDDAVGVVAWIENGINQPSTNTTISIVSDSSLDSSLYKARVVGFDSSGNPATVEIQLNGTTTVVTVSSITYVSRIEIRLVASPFTLTSTQGNVSVKDSTATLLGIIATGLSSGISENRIGMEGVKNGTTTTTNAVTAPSGVSMASPNTFGSGISFSGGGTLTHTGTDAQGIWSALDIKAGVSPAEDATASLVCRVSLNS